MKTLRGIYLSLLNFTNKYRYPLIIFSVSRFIIFCTIFLVNKYDLGFGTLYNWDAQQYISIASKGYIFNGSYLGVGSYIAFSPLYPITIRIVSSLTFIDTMTSALIISFIFGLISALVLYELVKRWGGEKVGVNAVFLFSFFPLSVFLTAPYTESLFIFLVLLFFLVVDMKKWLISSIIISLALITRVTGFILIPIFIYELFKNRIQLLRSIMYLFLMVIPFGLFIYFQYVKYGTPFAFLVAEKINWYHQATYPWIGFMEIINYLNTSIMYCVDLFFLILMLITLLFSFRKIHKNIIFFGCGVVLLSLSQTFPLSISRYMIAVIPFYFLWGMLLEKRPLLRQLIFIAFGGWMVFNTILFVLHKLMF